jgi:hypothetical protein
MRPAAEPGATSSYQKERLEPFEPVDRSRFSESALLLLDRYRIANAKDPLAICVSMIDSMNANQREVISRFEAAIALAGIEFGRIDLAIEKAEETQRAVKAVVLALDRTQKDFASTTNKIRQRSNCDIILNHLKPCIYGLFGATITVLIIFIKLRWTLGV